MSDESDNESAPIPPGLPGADEADTVLVDVESLAAAPDAVAVEEGSIGADPLQAAMGRPPPKPKSRAAMPSVRPVESPSALPVPPVVGSKPPLPRRSSVPPRVSDPPPASHEQVPISIKPMRMIKLGQDRPRSEPPPSSLDRLSSRPLAPRALTLDAPTEPSVALDPPTEPNIAFEPPTPPIIVDLYEGSDEEVTPTTPHASARPGPASSQPHPQRSKPPPPPSARVARDSSPEIEVRSPAEVHVGSGDEPPSLDMSETPEVEVAPASDEEPISVPEPEGIALDMDGPLADPMQLAPAAGEEPAREPEKKKPPPPPKRGKEPPPAPSEHAVQKALEPPKFETVTPKARMKPWWEELFTDDFGRGIMPLSPAQVKREVDFIEESLGVAKGGVVLDLACGTGNHAVDLSGRGYGVVGFDLSLPQLAVAGEYAQERGQKINFLQGDMRDMSFDEVFDGIYCWNTSFGYFEEERNVAVAERVFKALRPGGSFLLDVVNRDFVVEHQPSQVWFEGDACVCMDDMSVDFITSRLRVKRTMMLDDGRTRECAFSIRIYSLHELGKLLHDIGFRVTEASGHPAYPGVFFGATSPRVVILAQKP
jgi:SAM-dependent methyltransferase